MALACSLASLLFTFLNSRQLAEAETETALNRESVQALTLARDTLRASGVPESELPPPIVSTGDGVDINGLVQGVTALVIAELLTDPRYRGVAGSPGVPCDPQTNPACVGPPGGDSSVPGPSGPPPSCEDDIPEGCKGDEGEAGPAGPAGQPGPPPESFFIPNEGTANPDDRLRCSAPDYFCVPEPVGG